MPRLEEGSGTPLLEDSPRSCCCTFACTGQRSSARCLYNTMCGLREQLCIAERCWHVWLPPMGAARQAGRLVCGPTVTCRTSSAVETCGAGTKNGLGAGGGTPNGLGAGAGAPNGLGAGAGAQNGLGAGLDAGRCAPSIPASATSHIAIKPFWPTELPVEPPGGQLWPGCFMPLSGPAVAAAGGKRDCAGRIAARQCFHSS